MLLNIHLLRKNISGQNLLSDILLSLRQSNPLNVTIMIVGIPKEIKNNENRVSLTPAGAHELVQRGHTVYIQHTAGINSGFSDEEYEKVGARILTYYRRCVRHCRDDYKQSRKPIECEYNLVRKGQLVFTYFHLPVTKN